MDGPWRRPWWPWRSPAGKVARASRRRQACRVEVDLLEGRRLFATGLSGLTVTVTPQVLIPPNGRYVPVTISGKLTEDLTTNLSGNPTVPPPPSVKDPIDARNESQAFPIVSVTVTDEYRQDEPRARAPLVLVGSHTFFFPGTKANPIAVEGLERDFTFSSTIFLQAKRSLDIPDGRHYYILVAARADQVVTSQTVPVIVPLHPLPPNSQSQSAAAIQGRLGAHPHAPTRTRG
jgi:hypothetical protein